MVGIVVMMVRIFGRMERTVITRMVKIATRMVG